MEKGKISVIMPTYNMEKYIEKAVNSVLNQEYKNFELIIIDDLSNDMTIDICRQYASSNSSIVFLEKNTNTGVSDTRNIGLSMAKGEYIYFMDSDDYIEPNMFKDFMDIMKNKQPDFITTGYFSEVDSSSNKNLVDKIYTKERFYNNKDEIKEDFIEMWEKHIYYTIGNKLYLKEIIDKNQIRFIPGDWGEDLNFNRDYLMHVDKLYNTSKCYYHYVRERSGASTKKYNEGLFKVRLKENREFAQYFDKYGISKEQSESFIAKRYIERTLGCIENLFHVECKLSFKEKYKHTKEIINHEETKKYIKIFKPNSKKIAIMLIPYKLHMYLLAMMMGKVLSYIKRKFPDIFNKLKNRR